MWSKNCLTLWGTSASQFSEIQTCSPTLLRHGGISHTVSGLQSTCDCRYRCLPTHRGHCHRSKPQPDWWHDGGKWWMSQHLINRRVISRWSYLLPAVYPVPPQDWRAAGCDPHSRQRVTVHLVLLDDALAFFVLGVAEINITHWQPRQLISNVLQRFFNLIIQSKISVIFTTYIPPCWPSWILLCLTIGQLLVLIWIPARALP